MRLVAAVLLVLMVAWLAWPRGEAPPPFASGTTNTHTAQPPPPERAAVAPGPERIDGAPLATPTDAVRTVAADAPRQRAPGPGSLDVLVLRGADPIVGARVRVWTDTVALASDLGDETPPLRERTTTVDGRATFTDLESRRIVVRADAGAAWRAERSTLAGDATRTLELRFGTGTIRGRALDDDGTPLVGLVVRLAGLGEFDTCRTHTAADGSYAFTDLAADRYWVQLQQGARWYPDRERQVSVTAGATVCCDYGPVRPHGEIEGRIVDAHGTPIPGERPLRFVDEQHGDERRCRTALDGTFCIVLPRGRWRSVQDDDARQVLTTVELGAFARLDVPWPGIRLVGHVSWPPGAPPFEPRALRDLYLRGPDGVTPSDHGFAHDGHVYVQWLELEPGDYELTAQGQLRFADAPREGVRLVLAAEPRVVTVPLNLAPR